MLSFHDRNCLMYYNDILKTTMFTNYFLLFAMLAVIEGSIKTVLPAFSYSTPSTQTSNFYEVISTTSVPAIQTSNTSEVFPTKPVPPSQTSSTSEVFPTTSLLPIQTSNTSEEFHSTSVPPIQTSNISEVFPTTSVPPIQTSNTSEVFPTTYVPGHDFEIAFKGPCGPLIKSDEENLELFWRIFRQILWEKLSIRYENIKVGKLKMCDPVQMSFTIKSEETKLYVRNELNSLIRRNTLNILIPGVPSVYRAIEVISTDRNDQRGKDDDKEQVLLIFILCAASLMTTIVNILLCLLWTRRRYRLRSVSIPNGHPPVTYSMDEVLQSWRKLERGKQEEGATAHADTTVDDRVTRTRRHEKRPPPVLKKPPPIVIPKEVEDVCEE